jgi:hypothetical protein
LSICGLLPLSVLVYRGHSFHIDYFWPYLWLSIGAFCLQFLCFFPCCPSKCDCLYWVFCLYFQGFFFRIRLSLAFGFWLLASGITCCFLWLVRLLSVTIHLLFQNIKDVEVFRDNTSKYIQIQFSMYFQRMFCKALTDKTFSTQYNCLVRPQGTGLR